jgi:hypothetical protein
LAIAGDDRNKTFKAIELEVYGFELYNYTAAQNIIYS